MRIDARTLGHEDDDDEQDDLRKNALDRNILIYNLEIAVFLQDNVTLVNYFSKLLLY